MDKVEIIGKGIIALACSGVVFLGGMCYGSEEFIPKRAHVGDLNSDGRQDIVCEYNAGRSIFIQQQDRDHTSYVEFNHYLTTIRAADSASTENLRDSLDAQTDSLREEIIRKARDLITPQ